MSPLAILEEAVDEALARKRWSDSAAIIKNYHALSEETALYVWHRPSNVCPPDEPLGRETIRVTMAGLWRLWADRRTRMSIELPFQYDEPSEGECTLLFIRDGPLATWSARQHLCCCMVREDQRTLGQFFIWWRIQK
jgi:hypothetical protein